MKCGDAIDAVVFAFSKAFGRVLAGSLMNELGGCLLDAEAGLKMPEVRIQVGMCLKRRREASPRTTDPSSKT